MPWGHTCPVNTRRRLRSQTAGRSKYPVHTVHHELEPTTHGKAQEADGRTLSNPWSTGPGANRCTHTPWPLSAWTACTACDAKCRDLYSSSTRSNFHPATHLGPRPTGMSASCEQARGNHVTGMDRAVMLYIEPCTHPAPKGGFATCRVVPLARVDSSYGRWRYLTSYARQPVHEGELSCPFSPQLSCSCTLTRRSRGRWPSGRSAASSCKRDNGGTTERVSFRTA